MVCAQLQRRSAVCPASSATGPGRRQEGVRAAPLGPRAFLGQRGKDLLRHDQRACGRGRTEARIQGGSEEEALSRAVGRLFEWQRLDPKLKRPFAIGLKSGEPLAFAGLWESWRSKDREALETFTILTTDPNEVMEPIHNRMPMILEAKDYDRWLDAGDPARPPVDLLRPTLPNRCSLGR